MNLLLVLLIEYYYYMLHSLFVTLDISGYGVSSN